MERFEEIMERAFADADMQASSLPAIDLYMDQILTLFDEGLEKSKRVPQEKLLTKTMINNYSKEQLILPVKGKKYSREQLMQLLCIVSLKPNLALADIKTLMGKPQEGVRFEQAYTVALALKGALRESLPALLREHLAEGQSDLSEQEQMLATALVLSWGASWLRRMCEGMVDQVVDNKEEKAI